MNPRYNYDLNGRLRNKRFGFRVSEAEFEQINRIINMLGITKQDYFIATMTHNSISIPPSSRIISCLSTEMKNLTQELHEINQKNLELPHEYPALLSTLERILKGLSPINSP